MSCSSKTKLVLLVACFLWIDFGTATTCFGSDVVKDLQTFSQLGDEVVGRELELDATVTFVDSVWGFIFIQDKGTGAFVLGAATPNLMLGDRVRIVGVGSKGDVSPVIAASEIVKLRDGEPPSPLRVKVSDLEFGEHDSQYVQVDGTVLQCVSAEAHTLFLCEEDGVRFHVCFNGSQSLDDLQNWIGHKIEVRGALGLTLQSGTETNESQIGTRKIEYLRVCCISMEESLLSEVPEAQSDAPQFTVLRGQVLSKYDDWIVLRDSQKTSRVHCEDLYGIGLSRVIRIAVTPVAEPKKNSDVEYQGCVIEELFSTRLPLPVDFHKLPDDEKRWSFVKVAGRPLRIEKEEDRILFDVSRDGENGSR